MLLHKTFSLRVFLFFAVSLIFFFSCSKTTTEKKAEERLQNTVEEKPFLSAWYYFVENADGIKIKKAESIDLIENKEFLPWTEACRISGLGIMYDPPLVIINKAGILYDFNYTGQFELNTASIFKEKTADGFYKTNAGNLIRFYNNTIFSIVKENEENPCLCRFNLVTKELTPVVFPHHFSVNKNAQLSGIEFNKKWYVSFKTEENEKVEFEYFSFSDIDNLLNGSYQKISQEEFIANTKPIDTNSVNLQSNSLGGIKEKLIDENITDIQIKFFSGQLHNRITLFKTEKSFDEIDKMIDTVCAVELNAENGEKKSVMILFGNGKLCLKNKSGMYDLNLPKLPEGFVYTYFSIKDGIILAGWEEQRFFEVGRAGFLLYKLQSEDFKMTEKK